MKKIRVIIIFILFADLSSAQELFVFTEPASNMAARSVGLRLNSMFMKNSHTNKNEFHLIPEIMWGASKKLMLHTEVFFSNSTAGFDVEGAGAYIKYRLFSKDEVHSHFRVSAFGRYSLNNSELHDAAIDLYGTSSGYESGLVATKLINKIALSARSSFVHAMDNAAFIFGDDYRNAVNYTLSFGKLLLPKEYTSYDQPNLNFMLEVLGQSNLGKNKLSYLDIAPSLQIILKSKIRFDAGYRFALSDKMYRGVTKMAMIRFEYNFFNVY